ncbi:MAG: hypothetical protein JW827_11020 [Spirochaetes bacterium]|nr:hypothetical protein [Spirochaetota bacterium]
MRKISIILVFISVVLGLFLLISRSLNICVDPYTDVLEMAFLAVVALLIFVIIIEAAIVYFVKFKKKHSFKIFLKNDMLLINKIYLFLFIPMLFVRYFQIPVLFYLCILLPFARLYFRDHIALPRVYIALYLLWFLLTLFIILYPFRGYGAYAIPLLCVMDIILLGLAILNHVILEKKLGQKDWNFHFARWFVFVSLVISLAGLPLLLFISGKRKYI